MNSDIELNVSGETTEVKLIKQCCARKRTRKRPESAMATFLAIEEVSNPIVSVFNKTEYKNTLEIVQSQKKKGIITKDKC